MRLRIMFRKIPKFLVMLLLVTFAFTVPFTFSDTASAPYISGGDVDAPQALESPEPSDVSATPQSSEIPPDEPDNVGFITVRMDFSDIPRGNLILINNDNRYDIPDEHGFVAISELKTASYRVTNDRMLLSGTVIEALNEMMDAFNAETGNDSVAVISAFRDYEKQQETLNEYIALVGYNEAQRWASPPGHSEHQAGLAVDFGIYSGGAVRTFLGTGVYAWFLQNSHEFGFILRFPANKTDITETAHEPWHFRYVGEPHAYLMYQNDWCLEEYIELLMDYTRDEPYNVLYNGEEYEIYFTWDLDVYIPFDCEFDISGNNIEGFIVTLKF